ncbi:PAS domain-containing sensor histidine kinase [Lacibacterium aquatile]|uniref:histidine kinase n=1 Tax=Lacibacterium aquatile TaxID=1168082 RepID=A0ABW5DKY1_9PROT
MPADAESDQEMLNRRFRLVAEATRDGLWDWEPQSGRLWCSASLNEQLGYGSDEIVPSMEAWGNLADPEDFAAFRAKVEREMADGGTRFESHVRFWNKDGRLVSMLVRAIIERDAQGRVLRIVGSNTDISALRETEEKLQRSAELIQLAIVDANDGLWDLDMETQRCDLSPRLLQMLGYKEGDWPNTLNSIYRLMHPDDLQTSADNLKPVLDGKSDEFTNYPRFLHKDGTIRHVQCKGKVVRDGAGKVTRIVGWHTDLTDRIEYERQLERLAEENRVARMAAEAANRAKSAFLANMSHELRTPLNAIIGFSEMLEGGFGRTEKTSEYAGLIHKAGGHLLDLISDVLDYSKIEAGALVIEPRLIDLRHEVREAVRLQSLTAMGGGLVLVVDSDTTPVPLNADQRAVRQMLTNLLANAIKFTDAGGTVRAEVTVEERGVVLAVSDTGVGIAPELLPLIGRPFTQLSDHYSKRYQGSGLGLSIVKSLAALHGADVEFDSAPNKGTTVRIVFAGG